MKLDLFIDLLDTFGADFRRWPAEHRAAAEALRNASPEVRASWAAAQRLDALFAADRARLDAASAADPVRRNAIANAALRRIRTATDRGAGWRWLLLKPVGAALTTTVLAGWVAGTVIGPNLLSGQTPETSAVAALLGYGGTDIEELI